VLRIEHGGKALGMGIKKVLIALAMSWCLRPGAPGFGQAAEPVVAVSERWGIPRVNAFLVRYARWFSTCKQPKSVTRQPHCTGNTR